MRCSLAPIAIALVVAGCGLESTGARDEVEPIPDSGIDATMRDAAITIDAGDPEDASDAAQSEDVGFASDAVAIVDASPADTSTVDASDAEAGNVPDATTDAACAGALCNGACLTALDCSACTAAPLFCASTRSCTTDCATCTGNGPPRPVECYRCDVNRSNPIGTCEPNDPNAYCLNGSGYGTATHCGCSDAAPCPGRTLVCTDIGVGVPVCATCGEPVTDKLACMAGGKCNAMKGRCN